MTDFLNQCTTESPLEHISLRQRTLQKNNTITREALTSMHELTF